MQLPWQTQPQVNTQTLNNDIQVLAGTKQPDLGGLTQEILTGRLNEGPQVGDYLQSAIGILHGQYNPAQTIADERTNTMLKQISTLSGVQKDLAYSQYYQGGGGLGGGGTTAFVYKTTKDSAEKMLGRPLTPEEDLLLMRQAQGKVSSDLTLDIPSLSIKPINNAPQAAGAMKQGEAMGTAIGKAEGEIVGGNLSKANQAKNTNELTAIARQLLPVATNSGLGAGVARGKKFFGVSDEATQADSALDIIGGRLVATVPRFEGPQSNYDVQLYQAMAGKIADRSEPYQNRLQALDVIDQLNQKYGTGELAGEPAPPPAAGGAVQEGQTAVNKSTGQRIIFKGGQWQPM
jgi:hypothetical protein